MSQFFIPVIIGTVLEEGLQHLFTTRDHLSVEKARLNAELTSALFASIGTSFVSYLIDWRWASLAEESATVFLQERATDVELEDAIHQDSKEDKCSNDDKHVEEKHRDNQSSQASLNRHVTFVNLRARAAGRERRREGCPCVLL